MESNYYQNKGDDYQSQDEHYPSDAYEAWDIDKP